MISSYYSYNIHNDMFLLNIPLSRFSYHISSIHAFENYFQSIVLYGLNYKFSLVIHTFKDGNTLEHEPKMRHAEPARYANLDGTPSRGKQAWLATRPDLWPIGLSKWAFTEPQLVCAKCGQIISVFGEPHRGTFCLL